MFIGSNNGVWIILVFFFFVVVIRGDACIELVCVAITGYVGK